MPDGRLGSTFVITLLLNMLSSSPKVGQAIVTPATNKSLLEQGKARKTMREEHLISI